MSKNFQNKITLNFYCELYYYPVKINFYKNHKMYANAWVKWSKKHKIWTINFNLKYCNDKTYIHGTIAHECLHYINRVLSDRGIIYKLGKISHHKGDEAHAAFMSWLVNSIYFHINNHEELKKYLDSNL